MFQSEDLLLSFCAFRNRIALIQRQSLNYNEYDYRGKGETKD